MTAWVKVAELAKPKTLQGGLVARSAPGLPFLLEEGMQVAFVPPRHDVMRGATVAGVEQDVHGRLVVRFAGVDGAEAAKALAGMQVLARREDLPEDLAWADASGLRGWEVREVSCGPVGTVLDVLDAPGQTLLSIARPDGRDPALVPLVDAFVVDVDEVRRVVTLSLPDGLLDL